MPTPTTDALIAELSPAVLSDAESLQVKALLRALLADVIGEAVAAIRKAN